MCTWNVWSPRLGVTARLSADGRTMLRGSYGRFSQGVFTGELSPFHPGVTPTTTYAFDRRTGDYTRFVRAIDSRINLLFDPGTRAPHTDEYSIGIDREIARRLSAAIAYIHKDGSSFIGWTDMGGQYREEARTLPDGRQLPVLVLVNSTSDQRFLLTNPGGYSLAYNGIVMAVEKRRSHGWQAFASYTFSRASGLQASSGETAAGAQASTIATPTRVFGRDPNDLTNARGRLPNDRPHAFRSMGTIDVPRIGVWGHVTELFRNPVNSQLLRSSADTPQGNAHILEYPTNPVIVPSIGSPQTGTVCVASTDRPGRDNWPGTTGEIGGAGQPKGKVSCFPPR